MSHECIFKDNEPLHFIKAAPPNFLKEVTICKQLTLCVRHYCLNNTSIHYIMMNMVLKIIFKNNFKIYIYILFNKNVSWEFSFLCLNNQYCQCEYGADIFSND